MELVKQQASSKRRLKLGDIAEHLQVKKFVIRTWEKELGLAPQSGFYGAEAIELFKKIKQLVLVDRKSLQQVRAAIGITKAAESVFAADDVASRADLSGAAEVVGQACNQVKDYTELIPQNMPTESVESGQFVAASYHAQDLKDEVDTMMVAPAELCEEMSKSEPTATVQAMSEQAQQKFQTELAFFRQELLKFQQLLNT